MDITGYRFLTKEETDLINEGKELARKVGQFTDKVRVAPGVDPRWLATGITDLQKGFMSVTRSIARPTTF